MSVKVLDLFAGSRSFSREAEAMRMRSFSIDFKPFKGISLVKDIEFVTPDDIKDLARPVLDHRVLLRPEFEIEGLTIAEVVQRILDEVAVPR